MASITHLVPSNRAMSHTYHPQPDDPFELIDVEEASRDYGKELHDKLGEVSRAVSDLAKSLRDAGGTIDIDLESVSNVAHGRIGVNDRVALLVALSVSPEKVFIRARSSYEVKHIVFDLLADIMERIDDEYRPKWWDTMESYNGDAVSFYRAEDKYEFRLCVMALELMGLGSSDIREMDDEKRYGYVSRLSDYGYVTVHPQSEEQIENCKRLALDTNGRCVFCGRRTHEVEDGRAYRMIRVGRYTTICADCVEGMYRRLYPGS